MAKYITIDCGTTNTRIAFLEENVVKDVIKLPIGAGNTAQNGSNAEDVIVKVPQGTIITDNELIQYAADSIKQRGTYQLQDTTYHKDNNIYTGTIIWLEHEISFSIKQDTLEYRHDKFKGEDICGNPIYVYKKELD